MLRATIPVLVLVAAASAAHAQPSNVTPADKYAWGETTGFINFRDAGSPAAAQGVVVHPTHLSGYAWGETIGWIQLGDGAPGLCGGQYANCLAPVCTTVGPPDFGVNITNPTAPSTVGETFGFAWGETVGWVNFGPFPALAAAERPRYDFAAKRLRGYAWGETIGWINLDNATTFVGTTLCRADTDGDGAITPADVAAFINLWFCSVNTGVLVGDFDGSGQALPADVAAYVNAWFAALAGC